MFVSMAELALPAPPNSFSAFILFNLIVLALFLRLRSGLSDSDTQDAFPGFHSCRQAERWPHQVGHVRQPVKRVEEEEEEEEPALVRVTEACKGETGGEEENGHNSSREQKNDDTAKYEHQDDGEDDDGNRDELRRRIEDFISKVNREWREENQRARIGSTA